MQENPKLITRFKEGIKYFENKQGSMEINLLRQCESEFSLEHSSNQLDQTRREEKLKKLGERHEQLLNNLEEKHDEENKQQSLKQAEINKCISIQKQLIDCLSRVNSENQNIIDGLNHTYQKRLLAYRGRIDLFITHMKNNNQKYLLKHKQSKQKLVFRDEQNHKL